MVHGNRGENADMLNCCERTLVPEAARRLFPTQGVRWYGAGIRWASASLHPRRMAVLTLPEHDERAIVQTRNRCAPALFLVSSSPIWRFFHWLILII